MLSTKFFNQQVEEGKTEKALAQFLRPEFINRVDEIITFNSLSVVDFEKIADIMLGKLKDHLLEKGIIFKYTKNTLAYIAKESYSEKFGARNMRRFIEKNIEDKIAEIMIDHCDSPIVGISVTVDKDAKLKIDSI